MRRGCVRGAILSDVLIAVFILSVGLLALVGLFIQVGQAGTLLNRHEQAACLAQQAMERLGNLDGEDWTAEDLATAVGREQLPDDGTGFTRTASFQLRPDLDPAGHLAEVAVQVHWQEAGQNRVYSLVTYFAVDTGLENLR